MRKPTVALFISGRLFNYTQYLLPFVLRQMDQYSIKVFVSVNTYSFGQGDDVETIKHALINDLSANNILGNVSFGPYKMPRSYVENRLRNNISVFLYNCLSCFYHDHLNFSSIEKYQTDNSMFFDIICKIRSDIIIYGDVHFTIDTPDTKIIRNKHICDIRYWGHIYSHTPVMISDAFAYGNFTSMKLYCDTYKWILDRDLERNGTYSYAFEIYLTDSILGKVFYTEPGGGYQPELSADMIIDIYTNNNNNIKIITDDSLHYSLIDSSLRSKHNFVVSTENYNTFTE